MTLSTALKVHLRVIEIHGAVLRVVTLRPQTQARFSTNYFHNTWHILAGTDGAALFGRLLWGLAFQRHAGTLLLIGDSHLVPTPFEADPPDPIMVVPAGLTSVDDDALRALKLRLRRAPAPPTTIRWHTFGMPAALERDRAEKPWRWHRLHSREQRERMSRRAGFVCYTAPPDILRNHALGIYSMHVCGSQWGAYHPLVERGRADTWGWDGEFQVIPSFADGVSTASVARRELVDRGPLATEEDRQAVYRRQADAAARLRAARRRPR
jgi:hypothetical protein